MDLIDRDFSRYVSPVNPAVYPHLSVVLLVREKIKRTLSLFDPATFHFLSLSQAIGLFFTAWFFVYEVTSTKFTRELFKEVLISLIASVFMGLGTMFLLLWVGIYV